MSVAPDLYQPYAADIGEPVFEAISWMDDELFVTRRILGTSS